MEGLAVVLFPVLLMFFALFMERVEGRLSKFTGEEDEVEQFFEKASEKEVNTFVREGLPQALDVLHLRRNKGKHPEAEPLATPGQ